MRNENIEALSFPVNEIDLFVVEDVLEHVFRPDTALNEMLRCLKPGGALIASIPLEGLPNLTRKCADLKNGEIVYFQEARYHGAPAGSSKSLVVWEYGTDVLDLLLKWTSGAEIEMFRGAIPRFEVLHDRRATFIVRK
jgi:SAM-dependent methyltransferase